MAIKNLNTIVAALQDASTDTLAAIINNEMVDVETLTAPQKLCALVFDALSKGINTTKYQLVLDCNFSKSKFHNHEDAAEDVYKVDYFRVIPVAVPTKSLIQIYAKPAKSADGIKFDVCTSCRKEVLDRFLADDELGVAVRRNGVTGANKTSCRQGISYDELVPVLKSILAILADVDKAKAAQKKDKKDTQSKKRETPTVLEQIAEILDGVETPVEDMPA